MLVYTCGGVSHCAWLNPPGMRSISIPKSAVHTNQIALAPAARLLEELDGFGVEKDLSKHLVEAHGAIMERRPAPTYGCTCPATAADLGPKAPLIQRRVKDQMVWRSSQSGMWPMFGRTASACG